LELFAGGLNIAAQKAAAAIPAAAGAIDCPLPVWVALRPCAVISVTAAPDIVYGCRQHLD